MSITNDKQNVFKAIPISDTWKGWYSDASQGQCDLALYIKVYEKKVTGNYSFIIPVDAGPHFSHTNDSGSVVGYFDSDRVALHLTSFDSPNKVLDLKGRCVSIAYDYRGVFDGERKDTTRYAFSLFGIGEDTTSNYYTCGSFYVSTKTYHFGKRPDNWK